MVANLDGGKNAIEFFVAVLRTLEAQNPGFLQILEGHWKRIQENPDEVDLQMIQTFGPLVRLALGYMSLEEGKEIIRYPTDST